MKYCEYCGETKPVSSFRKYSNRDCLCAFCKECEKIRSRYMYLRDKQNKSEAEIEELNQFVALFDLQEAAGLRVHGRRRDKIIKPIDLVANLMKKYERT